LVVKEQKTKAKIANLHICKTVPIIQCLHLVLADIALCNSVIL